MEAKTITTKYIYQTNSHPSRVSAECEDKKIYVQFDCTTRVIDAHWAAAMKLIKKLGWRANDYVAGRHLKGGYIFVPADNPRFSSGRSVAEIVDGNVLDSEPLEDGFLRKALKNHPGVWIPTTEDEYYEMLGSVPPECQTKHGFLVGEPANTNADGEHVYEAFLHEYKSAICYVKHMTKREFSQLANTI